MGWTRICGRWRRRRRRRRRRRTNRYKNIKSPPVYWGDLITWTNVDLSSVKSSYIYLMAISQEIHQPSMTKSNMKITHLKCHWNLPGGQWVNIADCEITLTILYSCCQGFCAKSSKHNAMWSSNAGTSQHGRHSLRCHWHVDDHPVPSLNAMTA